MIFFAQVFNTWIAVVDTWIGFAGQAWEHTGGKVGAAMALAFAVHASPADATAGSLIRIPASSCLLRT